MRKTTGLLADFDLPPAARTERLGQLYAVYAGNMPAPDEPQFDYHAFRKRNDELAQLVTDRGDPITFGNVANGTVALYLGTGAKLSLVLQAIASIELKEAERAARLSPSPSSLSVTAKPTDAPGWGHHEEMSEKDYEDVKDEWMSYFTAINERKRRAEQRHNTARADDDDDGDPYGDHPTKQGKTEISTLEVSMIEDEGTFMTLRSNKRKFPTPPPSVVPQPMPFLAAGTPEFFDWQAAYAGAQFDNEVPAEPIVASAAPEPPDPEPEQPDGPEPTAAPAQTTLADPKHFAHRLFDSGLPGPSGSHRAYFKGRPRSYEPYVFDTNGQDSDGQNSE